MAFNFSFKNHFSVIDLILDINSSSVGLAFISTKDDEIKMLYTKRYPIFFKDNVDASKFTERTLKILDTALQEASSTIISEISEIKKVSQINKVIVNFASPWYISKAKEVQLKKETPFKFTKENFESLIKKEAQSSPENGAMKIIEKNINQVVLNGYEMHDPFNKIANEIKLSFYIGQVSLSSLEQVSKIIKNHFPKSEINYHTHGAVFFQSIRENFLNLSNYVYFDIGGETTEIAIIQRGTMTASASVPYGKNDFIRNVCSKCKGNFDTTFSCLSMIANNETENKCESDMKPHIINEYKEWTTQIKTGISKFENIKELPNRVCIITSDDFRPIVEQFMDDDIFQTEIYKGTKSSVISLDKTKIESKIKYNNSVKRDLFLELSALYSLLRREK